MKPPSSVLLLNDAADPRAAEESRRLYQWLETRGVRVESSSEFDRKVLEQARPELIVVLGGDGTFLRALHGCDDCQVPFLGVRLGTFGYLAELEPDSWEPELQRLLDGHGRIEQWMRLSVGSGRERNRDRWRASR